MANRREDSGDLGVAADERPPLAHRRRVYGRQDGICPVPASDLRPVASRAVATADPTEARGWSRRSTTLVAVAIIVVTTVPVIIAGFEAATQWWFPAGDWAIIELRAGDVGSSATPLLGAYSRYGWNHPGPLLFWLLAIPYRLTGRDTTALLVGASLVNASALAGMLVFAYRRGQLLLLSFMAVACSLLVLNLGPDIVRDPWNPWITVVPFGLFVVLAWSATEGDRLALPIAAGVGSFLVQAHVGFGILVALLAAWAVVVVLRRRLPRRPLAWAGAVAGVCWLPVVVDLVAGRRNLVDMVEHFVRGDEEPAGLGTALGVTARELGLPQPWLGADEPPNAIGGGLMTARLSALAIPLLAFAVALVLAWRRGALDAVRFQLTVGIAAIAGVLSMSRITDEVFNYLIRWWWPVAALWWVAIAWSIWTALAQPLEIDVRARLQTAATVLAACVALWFSVGAVRDVAPAPMPADDWHPAMSAVVPGTLEGVPHDQPVLLENTGPLSGWVFDAMAARLAADGVDVRVRDRDVNVNKFGEHRVVGDDELPETAVWVVTGTPIGAFMDDPDFELLASYDPLSEAERQRYLQLEAELIAQLRAAEMHDVVFQLEQGLSLFKAKDHPAIDQELLRQVEELRGRHVPLAVFVGPASDPPVTP